MKKLALIGLSFLLVLIFSSSSFAAPGDYTLRFKGGPAFAIKNYENQFKFGGAFDYDLGFGWGVGLEALLGIKSDFKFQLMPHVRFTWLYIGPAELFLMAGVGYEAYESDSALGMKFGPGIVLPLGHRYEIMSDFTFNMTPVGTPGTPITLDWMIGIGFRFGGGG